MRLATKMLTLLSGSAVATPANTVAPAISGTQLVGSTLTTTNGTWTGSPTFTYQWKRAGASIGSARNSTYLLVSADAGQNITCVVTGTNSGGSASVTSNALTIATVQDNFTTSRSAGAVNGTAAEPGPGNRTVGDPSNRVSISGGVIVGVAGGSGTFNCYDRYGSYPLSATPQGLIAQITDATGRIDVVFANGSTPGLSPRIEITSPSTFHIRGLAGVSINPPATIALPQFAALVRDASGHLSVFWNNRLYLIDELTDATDWSAFLSWPTATASGNADQLQLLNLPSTWNDLYAMTSVNVPSPLAGTNYTATGNQVVRLTVTAPGVLANSAGLVFRGNTTNGWRAYFDSAGAFKVAQILAGVEQAASINVASVIAAGATVTISLTMDGNLFDAQTLASNTPTIRGVQITNSFQAANANLQVEIGSGWTVSNLRSWQVDKASYATDLAFLV